MAGGAGHGAGAVGAASAGPGRPHVDQVERAIFQWITWYNEERLHSALDYVPPTRVRGSLLAEPGANPAVRLSQSRSDSTKLGAARIAPQRHRLFHDAAATTMQRLPFPSWTNAPTPLSAATPTCTTSPGTSPPPPES
ncbi:integrase core domain-containing protein [Streptomyces sp. NPDC046332]|uniref:integrase core domain-containing protein n=1 Tax=Streptomyces sp. NPDC046332 TaxID=3155133 RepID=UPI0033E15DF1